MGIGCRSVLCCELKISSSDLKTTTTVYMYSLYEGRLKRSLATLATRNRDHICHSSSVPQPQNSRRSPQAGVFRCPWPHVEMERGATTLRKKGRACIALCAGSRFLPGSCGWQSSPITNLWGKATRKQEIIFVPTVFGFHAHSIGAARAKRVNIGFNSTRLGRRQMPVMRKREGHRALHREVHRAQHWQYRVHLQQHRCRLLRVATSTSTGQIWCT